MNTARLALLASVLIASPAAIAQNAPQPRASGAGERAAIATRGAAPGRRLVLAPEPATLTRRDLATLLPLVDLSAPTVILETEQRRASNSTIGGVFQKTTDDFSPYILTNFSNPPASLISVNGQTGSVEFSYQADAWLGAATDAVMLSVAPGAPGGVPPTGLLRSTGLPPGMYAALARRSGQDALTTAFALAMNQRYLLRAISVQAPIAISTDWQLLDAATNEWWEPISFTEGCIADRVFFGGTEIVGLEPFSTIGPPPASLKTLDTFVSLGLQADNPLVSQFYAPPRSPLVPFPVGQWFTLMEVMSVGADGTTGQSLWLKTADSEAAGFLDPRLANGSIVPNDNTPAGWVNIYPGMVDDPGTMAPEGIGLAQTAFGQLAPTFGHLGQGPLLAKVSLNALQYGEGFDPPANVVPGFQANDAFIDNSTISGILFDPIAVKPDNIIPFSDGFELYRSDSPAGLNSQHMPYLFPPAMISQPSSNTHLVLSNGYAERGWRNRLGGENFPILTPRAQAQVGAPLVVSLRARISGAPGATTREIVLLDSDGLNAGSHFNDEVAGVVFGPIDPTDGVGAASTGVWVRQPNPAFNINSDWDDASVEPHWLPSSMWSTPPAGGALNTRFSLVPTGVAFPTDVFFDVRFEIEPDATDPAGPATLRVFIAGAEVFPNGDPLARFVAGSTGATSLAYYSGQNEGGAGDTMLVDDVSLSGPTPAPAQGSAFSLPFAEGFTNYRADETIGQQGATTFLDLASIPDGQSSDFRRMLTVIPDPAAIPAPGDPVCRYTVDTSVLPAGLITPGQTVAIPFADLPAPLVASVGQNSDCPGNAPGLSGPGLPIDFVVRSAPGAPRIDTGTWTLQNDQNDPVPFNSGLGDITGFRFDFFTEARWSITLGFPVFTGITPTAQNSNARVRTLDAALPGSGAPGDQVLEIRGSDGVDGATDDFSMAPLLDAILPAADATPFVNLLNPTRTARVSFDIYIENLNPAGSPDNTLAPRSRFAIPIVAPETPTLTGGRITTVMFGGPHVNEQSGLQNHFPGPIAPILADDLISVAIPSGVSNPDTAFASTGISLLTGGAGLDGVIAGPLVNRWFRVIATVDGVGDWTLSIDEDRDGSGAPVMIATGSAIDAGSTFPNTNVAGIERLGVEEGRDLGSGGEPVARRARIRTLPGGATAIAPAGADPINDYCFYQTTTFTEFIDATNPPQIFEPDPAGPGGFFRNLGPFSDILAVLNRRRDGAGNAVGPMIHDPCPIDIASGVNKFELVDESTGQPVFRSPWEEGGLPGGGYKHVAAPAGGINVPDGPAQIPPRSYNDPSLAAGGAQAPILLAEWALDSNDGWDPMPPILPRSRWLLDNITLDQIVTAPCADLTGDGVVDGVDLATVLNQFGGAGSADLNGDGVVDGVDLASILNSFGPCP